MKWRNLTSYFDIEVNATKRALYDQYVYQGDLYIKIDISTVEVTENIGGRLVKVEKTRYTFKNIPMLLIDLYQNHYFTIKPKILSMISKFCDIPAYITNFNQIENTTTNAIINV